MTENIFSPNEQRILKILGRKKTITLRQLIELFYDGEKQTPMNGGIVIASAVRNINKKCEFHRLPWFLNGMGQGRAGKTIWKDKLTTHKEKAQ